jgi:hypothetical protein
MDRYYVEYTEDNFFFFSLYMEGVGRTRRPREVKLPSTVHPAHGSPIEEFGDDPAPFSFVRRAKRCDNLLNYARN